jgi:hypothetical protein
MNSMRDALSIRFNALQQSARFVFPLQPLRRAGVSAPKLKVHFLALGLYVRPSKKWSFVPEGGYLSIERSFAVIEHRDSFQKRPVKKRVA